MLVHIRLLLLLGLLGGCTKADHTDMTYDLQIGNTPVFVIGVMHVLPERLSQLSRDSMDRFHGCRRLATEFDFSTNTETVRNKFKEAGAGTVSLRQSSAALVDQVTALLQRKGLSSEAISQLVDGPLVLLYRTLQVVPNSDDRKTEKFSVGPDSTLATLNEERKGEAFFLESVDDYVSAELKQKPDILLRKIAALVNVSRDEIAQKRWTAFYEASLRDYASGDADVLVNHFGAFYASEFGALDAFGDELDLRSQFMASRIASIAKEGPCLVVAIGAGHVGGPQGVVATLVNQQKAILLSRK